MRVLTACACIIFLSAFAWSDDDFVNFESVPVTPIDISPDGNRLAVCHLPANRLLIFDLTAGVPEQVASIPVGLDPVSVRWRNNSEAWVVCQISDAINIVDVDAGHVRAVVPVEDMPTDVEFAGDPVRAYVTCAGPHSMLVFDPDNPMTPIDRVAFTDDGPWQMRKLDGGNSLVIMFFFSSKFTIVGGDTEDPVQRPFPPQIVDDPAGPYEGQNPPPQLGPPVDRFGQGEPLEDSNPDLPPWPRSSLILTGGPVGLNNDWQDGQFMPWAEYIYGAKAHESGRIPGWNRRNDNLAIVDTDTLAVEYVSHLLDFPTAIAVSPTTDRILVTGMISHPYVRFEPNSRGNFVEWFSVFWEQGVGIPTQNKTHKLNPHILRADRVVEPALREMSLSDPRGAVWHPEGNRYFMTGMGSDNLLMFTPDGSRLFGEGTQPISVGRGPTGIVFDEARDQLYVLNRFEGSLSVVSATLSQEQEVARIPFFDPTPEVIQRGRVHFYNTIMTSGNGTVSCASCHLDTRSDRIGWNLGNPLGEMEPLPAVHNPGGGIPGLADELEDFHPVKGVMITQPLTDIIGKEPFHWRGDRADIEAFNETFVELLARDSVLTDEEMADMKGFLASLHYPPNPYRNDDNSLPTNLPLPGLRATGVFADAGTPLPNGNAERGLELFRTALPRDEQMQQVSCITCHTLPTGAGTNAVLVNGVWEPIPPGPTGESFLALVSNTGASQKTFKVPQLRNIPDKLGFDLDVPLARAGFGFMHDGSVDTLPRLLSEGHFSVARSIQDVADLAAFLLAFTGSGFEHHEGEPPGEESLDAHAAVGMQTIIQSSSVSPSLLFLLDLANDGEIALVAHWVQEGANRGAAYSGNNTFQTDQRTVVASLSSLIADASPERPVLFTAVPVGSEIRVGVDHTRNGIYSWDAQRDLFPNTLGVQNPFDPDNPDVLGDGRVFGPDGIPDGDNDFSGNGVPNWLEFENGNNPVGPLGDISGTGQATAVDVQLAINGALGVDVSPRSADVNYDGVVNALDVQLVVNDALGLLS